MCYRKRKQLDDHPEQRNRYLGAFKYDMKKDLLRIDVPV